MFAIILVYAILASTFVMGKIALAYSHPFTLVGVRMLVAGLCLLFYEFVIQRRVFKNRQIKTKLCMITKGQWLTLCKITFFHIYFAFSCEFWALQYVSSAKTNLIYATTPFIAAALSYLLLDEKLTRKKILGMIIGVLGIAPVTLNPDSFVLAKNAQDWIPELILFFGVFSASYAWFDIKKLLKTDFSLIFVNGFSMLFGGLACLLTAALTLGANAFSIQDIPMFTYYVLMMVLVSNIIFYNMYGWLMQRYSITFLTFAGFLCPIFGAVYGYFILSEEITWHYGLSLLIIAFALYLFYQEELKAEKAKSSGTNKL